MMEKKSPDIVRENLKRIRANIEEACVRSGRDLADVSLMAVTKTVDPELVNIAIDGGITLLGENRAQELLSKYKAYKLGRENIHFIGHLQTNKVRQVVDKVSMIESVDSLKLAAEIDRCAAQQGKIMDILVEVNIAQEVSKNGVLPQQLDALLEGLKSYSNIRMRGIMVIPPVGEGPKYFEAARNLLIDIKGKKLDNRNVNILSMGMSYDYVEAVSYGSNIVRIGRGLFGERN